ncbi:MAG: zinc ribbon domain-containing protein [Betaproteobacteria bacterium]|nr:zinc ribbon domain-containing protein [Betaproteobacteria bacterium]
MSQNLSETGILHFGLSHIPKALCNEKALFVLLATNLTALALPFLGYALTGSVSLATVLLIFPTLLLILPAGTSVAGLLLMDQARGQTPRPLRKAVSDGIPSFLRILGIALLGVVLMVIFCLFLGLLLFICKLPAVGPVLYAVLFPVLLILAGLLYFGLIAGLSMACPAAWSGATIHEILETLWRIAANRAVELLLNLFLLAVLIGLANFILVSIVFAGSPFVLGISASILSDSLISLFSSPKYTFAIIFGSMTGLMLFLTALTAMTMMGLNLIYLRITKDLPPIRVREYARNPVFQSANKKEPIIQPAPQATSDMSSAPGNDTQDILASLLAETVPAATVAENAETTQICPHCRTPTQAGDLFCGECGGRLQG